MRGQVGRGNPLAILPALYVPTVVQQAKNLFCKAREMGWGVGTPKHGQEAGTRNCVERVARIVCGGGGY